MDSNPSPVFPPDLERTVFETTAHFYPETIHSLLLVCRRVYEWIDGMKYATVTVNIWNRRIRGTCPVDVLLREIQSQSKPASFFHRHVQRLYVSGARSWGEDNIDLRQLFSACSGIHNLVLYLDRRTIDSLHSDLAAIRPRRLAVLQGPSLLAQHVDQHTEMFTLLTHFYIVNDALLSIPFLRRHDPSPLPPYLARLPALTHFAMGGAFGTRTVTLAKDILVTCKTLQVFVLIVTGDARSFPPVDDARFLYQTGSKEEFIRGWVAETRGGIDFWARADAVVAKKQRGEIQPISRCWIETEDGIPDILESILTPSPA
ncbi:hypothetical protein MSAN_02418500 [Mycena sanguinolenta]|uniref:Uncharacterized protein n=1 Tax=Mycena sanguinolenta TaxID=230812 RepID=A0A8H7CDV8_9AGAR|nr:hypothetical protein MSAN_02418500 [Mycena sanguinolenta]